MIAYSPTQSVAELQEQDLIDFGKLICSIGSSIDCSNPNGHVLVQAIEYMQQFFSSDLHEVIKYLLKPPSSEQPMSRSIEGFMQLIWSKTLDEVTNVFKLRAFIFCVFWTRD